MTKKYDLIIIGGGPGGYVAAIRARQLGMTTALIEREHLGGICLNWGCIPTKALLRSAEIYDHAKHGESFGLRFEGVDFDLKALVNRSRNVAKQLSGGVGHLMKKNRVDVYNGTATLAGDKVEVSGGGKVETLEAPHRIVATGARARHLPGFVPDDKVLVTYHHAMIPDSLPQRLLVIGSGAIGTEFASFYRSLGVDVTIVEVAGRILPVEDHEISELARKALIKRGIKILLNTSVQSPVIKNDTITVDLVDASGNKTPMVFDRAILAAGVVPNVEGLGLETTKAVVGKTGIETGAYSTTAHPGLYAIGDVSGPPMLAHKASHEAVLCVENLHGMTNLPTLNVIPGCTYCDPQVASVGLTEQAAKDQGIAVRIGRFPFVGNGKAIALGAAEGMVKTVFDAKTG
ncbi:MAG: dihydrolipoyl dehydrogenase, partial [Alphaproteobacteria bacterium]|nr:dihydrolipoyl dehydrogenase [Alphaproteobacteria bacterium]